MYNLTYVLCMHYFLLLKGIFENFNFSLEWFFEYNQRIQDALFIREQLKDKYKEGCSNKDELTVTRYFEIKVRTMEVFAFPI